MKFWVVAIAAVVGALAAIPLIPLASVVDSARLRQMGVEAGQIEGTIRSGHLYEVRLGSIALGDVSSRLNLADLSGGRLRFDLDGNDPVSRLSGGVSYGLGGAGLDDFSVGTALVAGPQPLGNITIVVEGLTVRFSGGACHEAQGRVRAYLSAAAGAVGLPSEMSGTASCRDAVLTFDLAGAGGREQLLLTIPSARKYRVRALIKPVSRAMEEQLKAKGFVPVEDGLAYEEERTV